MATPLPDPIKLLGLTQADIAALIQADGKWLAPLLLQAAGMARIDTRGRLVYTKGGVFDTDLKVKARQALYEWVYAYLEPRFDTYQSWATELAAENYSMARLEAVGDDGFTPRIFDRGAGVDSFLGWMLSSFAAQASAGLVDTSSPESVATWTQATVNEGADVRAMGAYNDTMQGNLLADPVGKGWGRATEPGACSFCAMLASRGSYGILYRSEQTANFRAHSPKANGTGGLCRCHAILVFSGNGATVRLSDGRVGTVRKLGAIPEHIKADDRYARYVRDALAFYESHGAIGLIAA